MSTIYAGQDVKVALTAQSDAGGPANPVSVRFKLKMPGVPTESFVHGVSNKVAEETPGERYTFTFDTPRPGRYAVRGEALDGSGEVIATAELIVLVEASKV